MIDSYIYEVLCLFLKFLCFIREEKDLRENLIGLS